MNTETRVQIESRAKELGHTVTEAYGVLEVWNAKGERVALFERETPKLRLLDAEEMDIPRGAIVISCH